MVVAWGAGWKPSGNHSKNAKPAARSSIPNSSGYQGAEEETSQNLGKLGSFKVVVRPDFNVYTIWLLNGLGPTKSVTCRELQLIGEKEPMAECDSESDKDQIVTVRIAPTTDLPQNTNGTQHDVTGDECPSEDHDHQDTGAQLRTCYRTTRGQHSNLQHLPLSLHI
ncbi:hypothetical protein LSAT2_030116 [Lamellibrachia satsuma]|nr:hypothetical protein LSAT2_030116 [Lamellibrachia satsuma]